MNPTPALSRRSLLRSGGLLAASGGLLAACGGSSSTGIARIGQAPAPTALEGLDVDDIVLVRTAMSMELLVAEILSSPEIAEGVATTNAAIIGAMTADHRRHSNELAVTVTALGGEPVDQANAKIMSVWGERVIELVGSSDRREADAMALAHGLEELLAATHLMLVPEVTTGTLRGQIARLSAASARRAAVLAQTLNPGTAGFAPGTDEEGNPTVATLPSAFGQTVAPQVQLGPEVDGARAIVVLDTPGPNSFVP